MVDNHLFKNTKNILFSRLAARRSVPAHLIFDTGKDGSQADDDSD